MPNVAVLAALEASQAVPEPVVKNTVPKKKADPEPVVTGEE